MSTEEQSTPPAPPPPSEPMPGTPSPDPPPPLPDPEIRPSSTPDGPQVVPAPSTPPGEPGPDPDPEEAVRASNPNAGSAAGLAGGMGVSSERLPVDPESIEGTGSRGTAVRRPDGTWPTGGARPDDRETDEHPQEPAEGPAMDELQHEATQDWGEPQQQSTAAG